MKTARDVTTLPAKTKSGIRWKRVVLAAFLSEIAVVAAVSATIGVYGLAIAPGLTDAESSENRARFPSSC
jgi:hypothetical protein